MKAAGSQPYTEAADSSVPPALRNPVPVWIFIILFVLLYWGMVYFDTSGGWEPIVYRPYHSAEELALYQPPPPIGFNPAQGKALFEQVCALCHNPDGAGKVGQAPPLAGSEWVNEPPQRMAVIPLVGLAGPITVKGQQWNSAMAAMGASFTDEQLANVLTYIRTSWGNKASEAKPEDVKAVRTRLGGRSQPMSSDEVKAQPEK